MHHSEPPDLCDDEQTVQKLLVEDDVRAELHEDPGGADTGPGGHQVGDCLQYKVKQDLSLKCSAWKGFIPCLEWKSPRPKQILDPKLYLGSLEYYGSKIFFLSNTNFLRKKFGTRKKSWVKTNFVNI